MNPKIKEYFATKVIYDPMGQYIWAVQKNGHHQKVADLRGWGGIQQLFKDNSGGIDTDKAAAFQDEIGHFIAEAITEKLSGKLTDIVMLSLDQNVEIEKLKRQTNNYNQIYNDLRDNEIKLKAEIEKFKSALVSVVNYGDKNYAYHSDAFIAELKKCKTALE